MTTLNQRILIPAGPDAVWGIISDINNNPKWQTDCQAVSFLTSLRAGPRVRWRYTNPKGDDYVVETTAWYDGLGYEYTFVDGAPFRESKGTIRLQEIAEGTIVSWTLNYEMGGALSGLRNAFGVRRHYDRMMIESLKGLWSHVKAAGGIESNREARSLMRDAPDYEARAQYTSRHTDRPSDEEAPTESEPRIVEPPLADDDTRPNLAVSATETTDDSPAEDDVPAVAEETPTPEPETMSEAASESSEDDVRFRPPEEAMASIATAQPETKPEPTAESEAPVSPPIPPVRPSDTERLPIIGRDRFGPKLDTSDLDTKDISIWEVFDVPKPSDSEQLIAIQQAESDADAVAIGDVLERKHPLADTPVPDLSAESVEPTKTAVSEPARATPQQVVLIPRAGFRFLARQNLVPLRPRQ